MTMTDKQLTALRKAGVWPEMLDYDTDGVFCWHEYQQWAVLPHSAAEALLIVEMERRLIGEGYHRREWDYDSDTDRVKLKLCEKIKVEVPHSPAKAPNGWHFAALFSALVAAGIVKETHNAN